MRTAHYLKLVTGRPNKPERGLYTPTHNTHIPHNDDAKEEENPLAVARAANEAALRDEWGADYEANKKLVTRAMQAFGEVKSHPEVIKYHERRTAGAWSTGGQSQVTILRAQRRLGGLASE